MFPKLLSTKADDFVQDNMLFNADDRKSGSARRFCCERLSDTVNSYTLEVSMCGYYLKGTQIMTQYTEDGCMYLSFTCLHFPVHFFLIKSFHCRYAIWPKCC